MAIIANIATFPSREDCLHQVLKTLSPQVDVINLVLNEYRFVPRAVRAFANVNPIFPDADLKDTGKFYPVLEEDDDVCFCDDDILYPSDYVDRLRELYRRFAHLSPVLGVHGVLYSDFFAGLPESRVVFVFQHRLDRHRLVNQLGTGTVFCKAKQVPPFDFMEGAQQFVDVRFAVHAYRQGYPMICIAREAEWLQQLPTEDTIFDSFTRHWGYAVTREAQEIAGFGKLNATLVPEVEAPGEAE